MLLSGAPVDADPRVAALRDGLRELGYLGNQSLVIEPRWTDRVEHLFELATGLVTSKVDVIVTQGTPAALAAKRATDHIPIVMATIGDPVELGLVASLARPGGNVTGNSILASELHGKRLELLRELLPKLSRVAVLWNSENPSLRKQLRDVESYSKALGMTVQRLGVREANEFPAAFQAARNGHSEALLVLDDPLFTAQRKSLVMLAARNRLPVMYGLSGAAEVGGLISYGPKLLEMFRHAATYVDKILKGARPAELPVEQPTKFELIVNLEAAKALDLTIPRSVLLRADRVIE